MKWVTWARIGVDRMACAWLIRRFLDPDAEFAFVPAGQQPLPAGAEPFDIPGTRLSHRGGHCSFHTLLHEYDLALRHDVALLSGLAWQHANPTDPGSCPTAGSRLYVRHW